MGLESKLVLTTLYTCTRNILGLGQTKLLCVLIKVKVKVKLSLYQAVEAHRFDKRRGSHIF
jgi:hypothetical protein